MTRTLTLQMRRRTPPQKRISESKARFNIAKWGRQSGKTTYGLDKITWKPFDGRRDAVYWYILQTHAAAEVAFNRYVQMVPKSDWKYLWAKRPNESEKTVFLSGYRNVFFKSGENYEDLRVETLDGCVIDEFRQQHPNLWPMVIRPMLARRKGWCDFLSTPNGFDHFFDLWQLALQDTSGTWATFTAPSTEAFWWSKEEVEDSRRSMSLAMFRQEILAEFVNIFKGSVYSNHGEWNKKLWNPFAAPNETIARWLPIIVGLDFNVQPMAWELLQSKARQFYFFDEIYLEERSNTFEASKVLVEKMLELKKRIAPDGMPYFRAEPNVILIGDASGNGGSTKTKKVGETDYTIIENALTEAKITFENQTPKENPSVKDRVNTVQTHLLNAAGDSSLWYHPKNCKMLGRDFERVIWKDTNGAVIDKTTDTSLTHASDGAGYPVCEIAPLTGVGGIGTLEVIRRG